MKECGQNEDKLREGFDKARDAVERNERVLEGRIYKLSVGALALSFTVFSFIAGNNGGSIDKRAFWICGGYALCIFLDTLSYVISRLLFIRARKKFGEKIVKGVWENSTEVNKVIENANKVTWLINYSIYLILFANMALSIWLINNIVN